MPIEKLESSQSEKTTYYSFSLDPITTIQTHKKTKKKLLKLTKTT